MTTLPLISHGEASKPGVDAETAVALYEKMLTIRLFEQAAGEVCRKGEIAAFLHLYIGEEAVAVGVCSHLTDQDVITSTHRGHGHVLAKGVSARKAMAELYAKSTGVSGGRGGSMHMYDSETGVLGTNGLVGGGIPSAVGAGLAFKTKKTGGVAVAFFGDGAVNHGAFHESMNLATTLDLPVLFVCENNLYATATPFHVATRNTSVYTRAAAYSMPGFEVDGQDVFSVREAAGEAIYRARSGAGPTLIEAKTYRFVGHSAGEPVHGLYRTKEEVEEWQIRDPLVLAATVLTQTLGVSEEQLNEVKDRVAAVIDDAVSFSRESPDPDPSALEPSNFCEDR